METSQQMQRNFYTTSSIEWQDDWWIVNDVEGSRRKLIEVQLS
jgi:hypothetical protein